MTREERLVFCGKCSNRGFDPKRGIICGLTEQVATFDGTCSDFNLDERMLRAELDRERQEIEEALHEETNGLWNIGIKNGIIAGIVLLVVGFGWLIGGLFINRIFFYPFFIIVGGLVTLIKGLNKHAQQKKLKQKLREKEDILDNY